MLLRQCLFGHSLKVEAIHGERFEMRGSKFGKRYSSTLKWITIANAYTAIWVTKAQTNLNNRKSLSPVSVVAESDQDAILAAQQRIQ